MKKRSINKSKIFLTVLSIGIFLILFVNLVNASWFSQMFGTKDKTINGNVVSGNSGAGIAGLANWFKNLFGVKEEKPVSSQEKGELASLKGMFASGDGSPQNPYQITNCQELQNINNNIAANYVLSGNIDCNGFSFQAIANNYSNPFTGTLDGNGFEIDKLTSSLFSYSAGIIKNLGLIDVNINNGRGLISRNFNGGIIENVHVSGNITCGNGDIGGLVGINQGFITNCSVNVNINSTNCGNYNNVGGLVGDNFGGQIFNSYSNGNIYGGFNSIVGGFVGRNLYSSSPPLNGDIENSYSNANVYGQGQEGGFIGQNYGSIINNCYSNGEVYGESLFSVQITLGGFAGDNLNGGQIFNSYSTGNVYGKGNSVLIAGFAGENADSKITNSFCTGSLSGSGTFEGFIEYSSNSILTNNYWYYSGKGSPDFCYNDHDNGQSNIGCTKISSLNYFYTISNPPINSWDFDNIWSNSKNGIDYPSFKWKTQISNNCNNDNICEIGENCMNCAADCTCSGTSPDCNPADLYSDAKGCTCQPNWDCSVWTPCSDWSQTRTCTDNNNCGINSGKPLEEQQCCSSGNNNGSCTSDIDKDCTMNDSELLYAINKWINA